MSQDYTVNIHGKQYLTVAGRVKLAHETAKSITITTEVLTHDPYILVKATVVTDKGTFTGMSAANPSKLIEKQSPYEVAETSAVGRALGFAGFGLTEGIATADEVVKAETQEPVSHEAVKEVSLGICADCGKPNKRYTTGKIGCSEYCWKKSN